MALILVPHWPHYSLLSLIGNHAHTAGEDCFSNLYVFKKKTLIKRDESPQVQNTTLSVECFQIPANRMKKCLYLLGFTRWNQNLKCYLKRLETELFYLVLISTQSDCLRRYFIFQSHNLKLNIIKIFTIKTFFLSKLDYYLIDLYSRLYCSMGSELYNILINGAFRHVCDFGSF